MATTTINFFAPDQGSDYEVLRGQRIRLVDYDEVTMTHRVEFPDGLRAVVRSAEIISRKVES